MPTTMNCPECRFENPQDAQFCTECGASLKRDKKKTSPEPPVQIVCPQCRSKNDQDAAFCIDCGDSLKPASTAQPAEPAPAPKPKPDLKSQAPLAPQLAAEPKPAPSLPVEPKLKVKLPAEVTLSSAEAKPKPVAPPEPKLRAEALAEVAPSAAKAMPEPATPPSPKKEPPAPAPARATSAGRQKIEQPVPASESAFPKAELLVVEKTSEPSQPRKGLLPAGIAAALAVTCLAVWYFALRPKPSARPPVQLSMPAETAPQAAPAPAPADASQSIPPAETQAQPPAEKESVRAAAQPTADISEQITLGVEAFQQKDYDECIKQMKAALSQDPTNKTARRYLADAERTRKEGREIAALLQAAGEAYQAGSFEQCLEQAKKILALDPGQAEALRYEEMAHQKLAPQRIKSLVDQFTAAMNGGQLLSYYETACLPALFQKIKRDVELMNGIYGQFKSQSSQTTIRFLDNGLIEARFSNITIGQLKTDNRRMIIFEGTYVWTLQRQGDRWMIVGLQSQPIRKKP